MDICSDCCMLSGRGLCDGPIPRTEEFYGYLSVMTVGCCSLEVPATSQSLVQGISSDCGVSLCVI
jgi:hypothetical protein